MDPTVHHEPVAAIEGLPTNEDLVLIGEGCSLACGFCMYGRGRAGMPLAAALDPSFRVPAASRITILAGDVLRPEIAGIVARARALGASEVLAYAHPGTSPAPVADLAAAGLTGLYLMLPAARGDRLAALTGGLSTMSRAARLVDAANAHRMRVAVEVPLTPQSFADAPDTVRRALARIAAPDRVVLRFLSEFDRRRGHVRWDHGDARDAVAAAIEEAERAGAAVRLAHPQAPPPCVLDLPGVTSDLYPGFMIGGWSEARPHPFDSCGRCAVATVCAATDEHLLPARPVEPIGAGADPPAGVPARPSSAALHLRQDAVGRLLDELRRRPERRCRFPWEELEAHDIRGTVTPCAGGWPRPEVVERCESWRASSLMAAWNSPGMREIRRAVASGRPFDACKRECPAFHGGPQTAIPPIPAPASRVFFDNLLLNLREMLDGAEVLASRPLSLSFSPTLRCPNRCRMCDVHEVREVMGDGPELREMPDALRDELLSLLPTTRMLALTGGEPLASRRMVEVLRAFDADRFPDGAVTITTNALLLRESLLRDLSRTRIRLFYLSFNAATEETYERVSGTRGGFPRVLANLSTLLANAPRMAGRPRVVLSFVVMRSTWRELPAFLDLARSLGCNVRLLPIERDRLGESVFTDEDELRRVLESIERDVRPRLPDLPWPFGAEVRRLESILRGKMERRDFTAL
ncbi:MAG: radical SAM protein [Deltaproteobacteria bacterium]|nr:radical SAM protein [Deltaproteobacteria bacterium]